MKFGFMQTNCTSALPICIILGRAGWRSGCSRAFHQCGPGSIPSRVRVVCEFGSRSILARAGFLRALRFPPASKIVSSFHISLKFISGGVP